MIATIELDEQAELAVPTYQPFVRIKGLDCWPNEPAWNQLKDGDALRQKGVNFESSWDDTGARKVTLDFGEHFDLVVLAVPPMVIRSVAPQLAKRSDLWRAMLENSAYSANPGLPIMVTSYDQTAWLDYRTDRSDLLRRALRYLG